MKTIIWTDYLQYRSEVRGFELTVPEHILRYTDERYRDTTTDRKIAIGRHRNTLVMIPYEETAKAITPVTVHATNRKQLNYRIKSGRLV